MGKAFAKQCSVTSPAQKGMGAWLLHHLCLQQPAEFSTKLFPSSTFSWDLSWPGKDQITGECLVLLHIPSHLFVQCQVYFWRFGFSLEIEDQTNSIHSWSWSLLSPAWPGPWTIHDKGKTKQSSSTQLTYKHKKNLILFVSRVSHDKSGKTFLNAL